MWQVNNSNSLLSRFLMTVMKGARSLHLTVFTWLSGWISEKPTGCLLFFSVEKVFFMQRFGATEDIFLFVFWTLMALMTQAETH